MVYSYIFIDQTILCRCNVNSVANVDVVDVDSSWQVVAIGECQARCNENGLATQDVRCAKLPASGIHGAVYIDEEHCGHLESLRPSTAVECLGSCNSARWLYSAWSEV